MIGRRTQFFTVSDRATSIRLWQRAIRRSPRDAAFRYQLAHTRLLGRCTQASARLALADLERALALTREPASRARILALASRGARLAGRDDKARRFARSLSSKRFVSKLGPREGSDAIHAAHQEIGRLAVVAGQAEAAADHLLESAKVDGSPVLCSFGPHWDLAEALLDGGKRAEVIGYLDRVRGFWKGHEALVDGWKGIIADGEIPDFRIRWKAERRVGGRRRGLDGQRH